MVKESPPLEGLNQTQALVEKRLVHLFAPHTIAAQSFPEAIKAISKSTRLQGGENQGLIRTAAP